MKLLSCSAALEVAVKSWLARILQVVIPLRGGKQLNSKSSNEGTTVGCDKKEEVKEPRGAEEVGGAEERVLLDAANFLRSVL